MVNYDHLYRYLFKNQSVRGELVTLNDTYNNMLENHDYPQAVQFLLAELLVATSLLTATLKFDGEITVQLQGDGPVKLVVINGNNHQQMRGVARVYAPIEDNSTLQEMIGNGYLLITITPSTGERYQGVVGLEGATVAECLESYFMQSEQLPTRLFIRTGEYNGRPVAGGMLLQVLPSIGDNVEDFNHLATLTETVKAQELFSLDPKDVLYRLYHQEEVTLFESQKVSFKCTCSHQRSGEVLLAMPENELNGLFKAEEHIDMYCDFCGKHYLFDAVDIQSFRANGGHIIEADNSQLH